jgi:HlyD family secretion protein
VNLKSKETRLGIGILATLAFLVVYRAFQPPLTLPSSKEVALANQDLPSDVPSERFQAVDGPYVVGNGVLEPMARETKLSSAIPGIVIEVLVKEGEVVSKDQVLIRLESGRERAAVAIADSDLMTAKAELKRSLKGLRKEDVEATLADTEAARVRAELSQTSFARLSKLSDSGGVSVDELDRARKQSQTDKATLDSAEARKRAALAGSRQEDIEIAHARVKLAEGNKEKALADFARTEVRAPLAGEILQIKTRDGEYASPGAGELLTMGDTTKLRARVDIDERNISKVALGNKGFVTLPAYPGKQFLATVVSVGKKMGRKNVRTDDPIERIDTKILETVLELDTKEGLFPGLRVLGYVQTGEQK